MNSIYILRVEDFIDDVDVNPVATIAFNEKPSVEVLRLYISENCSFKEAKYVYDNEPTNYNILDEVEVSLTRIDLDNLTSNEIDESGKYDNAYTSADDFLEFLEEFKEENSDALEKYYADLKDKKITLDEMIFDWYMWVCLSEEDATLDNFFKYQEAN